MTADLYTPEKIKNDFEVPDVFMPLILAHPRLLPGETKDSFYTLLDIMVGAVLPVEDTEWLATIDLAWLQFDIHRYRRWKNLIIMSNRVGALETALSNTHPGAALIGATAPIGVESKMQAQEMNGNPGAHPDLIARLKSHGYDEDTINARAFEDSMVPLVTVERLLSTARRDVALILREVGLQREFRQRASAAMKQIEHDEERVIEASGLT